MKKIITLRLIILVILVGGITNLPLQAQKSGDWKASLLSLDFDEVPNNGTYPGDPFHDSYVLVYKLFIQAMVCQTIDKHTRLSLEVDRIISLGKKQKKSIRKDFDRTSYLAGVLLFRAVSAGQYGEYLKSAKDLYSAYKYYQDMLEMEPNHLTSKIYGGIMAILYGELPDEYYSWLALLGIRMDPEDGFRQIKEVYYSKASSDRIDSSESALILIVAMREFDDNPDAAWRFVKREGLENHPNILIRYFSALAAFRSGETETAMGILDALADAGGGKQLPYIYYQQGRFRLYSEDPKARQAFENFLEYNCGDNYVKATCQKLAWHYIMVGDKAMSEKLFKQITTVGKTFLSADQQALREVENEDVPMKKILRLRLLFDGGYYEKCLDECSGFEKRNYNGLSNRQVVEVLYRQARSHQLKKNSPKAIYYYRKIVEKYPEVSSYQVPKSALNAGILLGKAGKKREALDLLDKCLKLNNHGYQSTIKREVHSARRKLK